MLFSFGCIVLCISARGGEECALEKMSVNTDSSVIRYNLKSFFEFQRDKGGMKYVTFLCCV